MKGTFVFYGLVSLTVVGFVWAPDLLHWPLWKFPAVVLGILLAGFAFLAIRSKIRFHRKGYEIRASCDPAEFEYRERHDGKTRSLKLPGDLIENGHPVYTRLTEEEWRATAPEWGKSRRLEIEG